MLELSEKERGDICLNHRFLIQSKVISGAVYQRISELPLNSRAEEVDSIVSFLLSLRFSSIKEYGKTSVKMP